MRGKLIPFLAIAACLSGAQTWEKRIAPGLLYRVEHEPSVPRIVHVLKFSLGSADVRAFPELAGGSVYEEGPSGGRETISEMAARTGALAAVNADFFPFTGKPLGAMVRDKVPLSSASRGRSVFGWGRGGGASGFVTFAGEIATEEGATIPISGLNEECAQNAIVVNTPAAGLARSKAPSLMAVIKTSQGLRGPSARLAGEVDRFVEDAASLPVDPESLVVVAHGAKRDLLRAFRPGQKVEVRIDVSGFDWSRIEHAVGGGPSLISAGAIVNDARAQGFNAEFSEKRHPRTAVGLTESGDLLVMVVDGRSSASVGATIDELARLMLRQGCVDAINLDGGGSSTVNLLGITVNRPSDGQERPVANGIVFIGSGPAGSAEGLRLDIPANFAPGQSSQISIRNSAGIRVPNRDVVWAASGAISIDQGGLIRATGLGKGKIAAAVYGKVLSAEVSVHPPPPKNAPSSKRTVSARQRRERD